MFSLLQKNTMLPAKLMGREMLIRLILVAAAIVVGAQTSLAATLTSSTQLQQEVGERLNDILEWMSDTDRSSDERHLSYQDQIFIDNLEEQIAVERQGGSSDATLEKLSNDISRIEALDRADRKSPNAEHSEADAIGSTPLSASEYEARQGVIEAWFVLYSIASFCAENDVAMTSVEVAAVERTIKIYGDNSQLGRPTIDRLWNAAQQTLEMKKASIDRPLCADVRTQLATTFPDAFALDRKVNPF
ncbi:hypothetical protein [Rhizobium leguminosarum]|uniref:hypothetical protein n=1 Tax=Rhizobium leguminosarum TaxID=384 RepID=UPI001031E6E2|nr:hypothetical protein [Rhizobium leguminosarum]TBF80825.1 hypothetical protein ELG86_01080 [Rhizobium leguminosarum]